MLPALEQADDAGMLDRRDDLALALQALAGGRIGSLFGKRIFTAAGVPSWTFTAR